MITEIQNLSERSIIVVKDKKTDPQSKDDWRTSYDSYMYPIIEAANKSNNSSSNNKKNGKNNKGRSYERALVINVDEDDEDEDDEEEDENGNENENKEEGQQ